MPYSADNLAELDLLMLYNSPTSLEGIKIHKTAKPTVIAAAQSLFKNHFITQVDGGYLTPLGSQAAEHAHSLYDMLNACSEEYT